MFSTNMQMPVTNKAGEAYKQAFQKSFFTKVRELFQGKSKKTMLSYEDLRERLHVGNQHDIGVQAVNVQDIVGTLGRNNDFDREFRPIRQVTQIKWENVAHAYYSGKTLPPVELIKVGHMYFVVDGNHRISVMRLNGQDFIDAHVIELDTQEDIQTTGEYRALVECQN